jgi:hypothetical protein
MSLELPEDRIIIYSKSAHRILHLKEGIDEIETINNIDVNSILIIDDEDSQIAYSISGDSDKKPLIKLKFMTKNDITVSYMFSGISWLPKADIIIEKKFNNSSTSSLTRTSLVSSSSRKSMSKTVNKLRPSSESSSFTGSFLEAKVYLSASINNNTGETFNTNTTLIAGSIKQPEINPPSRNSYSNQSLRMAAVPMMNESVSSSSYSAVQNSDSLPEDFKSYDLNKVKLYSKDILPLSSSLIPINKLYTHDLSSINNVNLSYKFNAPDFIPNCKVRLYTSKEMERVGSFIGESNLKESHKGTDVDISLGSSSVVLCQSSIENLPDVEIPDKSQNSLTYLVEKTIRLSSKITNCSHDNVTLILKYFSDSQEKTFSEPPYYANKDGYVEWHYDLDAIIEDDQQVFSFECIIKWKELVQKPIVVSPNYRSNNFT